MMDRGGLTKLIEECGELIQVAAKKQAYFDTDKHPDGTNLTYRLEEEISHVLAAITFVINKLELDSSIVTHLKNKKLELYQAWDKEI